MSELCALFKRDSCGVHITDAVHHYLEDARKKISNEVKRLDEVRLHEDALVRLGARSQETGVVKDEQVPDKHEKPTATKWLDFLQKHIPPA